MANYDWPQVPLVVFGDCQAATRGEERDDFVRNLACKYAVDDAYKRLGRVVVLIEPRAVGYLARKLI